MADWYPSKARKNGVARHEHSGLTERVREALRDGPLTIVELCARLKVHDDAAVRRSINQSIKMGGIVSLRGQRQWRYALYATARQLEPDPPELEVRRPRSKSGSGVIAGRKLIRGYLW